VRIYETREMSGSSRWRLRSSICHVLWKKGARQFNAPWDSVAMDWKCRLRVGYVPYVCLSNSLRLASRSILLLSRLCLLRCTMIIVVIYAFFAHTPHMANWCISQEQQHSSRQEAMCNSGLFWQVSCTETHPLRPVGHLHQVSTDSCLLIGKLYQL